MVNFGQSGWVSTQERIALALELRRGDIPDVAVFYDGVNDVFAAYQSGVAGIPQNEIKRQIDFERFELGLLARVADRSSIVRILRRIGRRDPLSPPSTRTAAERTALARAVVDDYAGNIRIVEALANRFDFDALHFWQPVVWSKARPTRVESEIHVQNAATTLPERWRVPAYGVMPAGTTLTDVVRAAVPYLICNLIVIGLLVLWPGLATWLVGMMG